MAATQESLNDLALRWQKWVTDTNELFSDSDMLGVPVTNGIHIMWIELRIWVEGLPDRIRDRTAVGERPLDRHDEEPEP